MNDKARARLRWRVVYFFSLSLYLSLSFLVSFQIPLLLLRLLPAVTWWLLCSFSDYFDYLVRLSRTNRNTICMRERDARGVAVCVSVFELELANSVSYTSTCACYAIDTNFKLREHCVIFNDKHTNCIAFTRMQCHPTPGIHSFSCLIPGALVYSNESILQRIVNVFRAICVMGEVPQNTFHVRMLPLRAL